MTKKTTKFFEEFEEAHRQYIYAIHNDHLSKEQLISYENDYLETRKQLINKITRIERKKYPKIKK